MFAFEEEYEFALLLVKEAACLFLPAYHTEKNVETKTSSADLVTGFNSLNIAGGCKVNF